MMRRTIVPLALVVAALCLGGCATTRKVAGEPSPKEDVPAEAAPAADTGSALTPDESRPAQPTDAPAPPLAPAPPAAGLIPADNPQIVARVERVQFPAWVERGGIKAGIKAGWAIYTSDRIVTGGEGRVELGTSGDGKLNIGGDTSIEMTQAYQATGAVQPSLFTLQRGSFRFTAPVVPTGLTGTRIEVGGAISANVISGEIVGRSDSEESFVALVEAVVQVSGPKLNPGTMREPNTFLRVPRSGKAQPVAAVPRERLARWLSQSERVGGRPMLSAEGVWDVSLNSGYSLKQLEEMACRIQRRGFPSEIYPVKEPGKLTWYRVVVRRFATKGDAVNFIGTAKALGSKEPWVLVPQS